MKISKRNIWPALTALFFTIAVSEALPWSQMFSANAAESAAAAKRKLAAEGIWLMEVKDGPSTPAIQDANLVYQADMENKGIKIIGGSVKDIDTGKRVYGIVMVHAKSRAEAQALVNADPGVKNGSRIVTLREFELNSGTVTFQMHWGDAGATEFR